MEDLTLTFPEIYYIGKKLNGDSLNYQYIARMPEIGTGRMQLEEGWEEDLVRKGAAEESLLDGVSLLPETAEFLYPLYHSNYESELVLTLDQENTVTWMFHRAQQADAEQWLGAELKDKEARFSPMVEKDGRVLEGLLDATQDEQALLLQRRDGESDERMLFVYKDGWNRLLNEEEQEPVDLEQMKKTLYRILFDKEE